jgi:hypothetical protein
MAEQTAPPVSACPTHVTNSISHTTEYRQAGRQQSTQHSLLD